MPLQPICHHFSPCSYTPQERTWLLFSNCLRQVVMKRSWFILLFAGIKNITITVVGHSISNLETPQVTVLYWLAGLAGLASLATLLQLCVYSLCRWKSDWEWTLFALQSTSYGSIPTAPTFSNWIPFPSGLFPPIRDYDPHIDTWWETTKPRMLGVKVHWSLSSS